jgi:tripartite-type tricarboxylate transporter receptor subunit TctC
MSGQLAVMFGNVTGPLAHIRAGRLRAIAVTGPQPSPVLPGVPRVAELYPGFELITWMGIFVPSGTPEPVRSKLQGEFVRAVQSNEVRERLVGLGNEVIGGNGQALGGHVNRELELYAKIIKMAGIRPQ